jgi:hypothetical protein
MVSPFPVSVSMDGGATGAGVPRPLDLKAKRESNRPFVHVSTRAALKSPRLLSRLLPRVGSVGGTGGGAVRGTAVNWIE